MDSNRETNILGYNKNTLPNKYKSEWNVDQLSIIHAFMCCSLTKYTDNSPFYKRIIFLQTVKEISPFMKRPGLSLRSQALFTGIWSETAETVPFHTVIFPLTSFPISPFHICPCLPVTTSLQVTQVILTVTPCISHINHLIIQLMHTT
jgi:hypothetical protein